MRASGHSSHRVAVTSRLSTISPEYNVPRLNARVQASRTFQIDSGHPFSRLSPSSTWIPPTPEVKRLCRTIQKSPLANHAEPVSCGARGKIRLVLGVSDLVSFVVCYFFRGFLPVFFFSFAKIYQGFHMWQGPRLTML